MIETMDEFIGELSTRAGDQSSTPGFLRDTEEDTLADLWDQFARSPIDKERVLVLSRAVLGRYSHRMYGYDHAGDPELFDRLLAERGRAVGLFVGLSADLDLGLSTKDIDGTNAYIDLLVGDGIYERTPDGGVRLAPGQEWFVPDDQGRWLAGPQLPTE